MQVDDATEQRLLAKENLTNNEVLGLVRKRLSKSGWYLTFHHGNQEEWSKNWMTLEIHRNVCEMMFVNTKFHLGDKGRCCEVFFREGDEILKGLPYPTSRVKAIFDAMSKY